MGADTKTLVEQIHKLGDLERAIFASLIHRKPVTKNVNDVHASELTFGERVADRVASFGGSWTFIFLFLGIMVVWMTWNVLSRTVDRFDPYPFILLNLALSCLAALQAPVIMMSQNRAADKDRANAQADYEINLKAEMEVMALHAKIDELRAQQVNELLELHKRQLTLIEQLESALREKGIC
jgi:uncharacterized membrane protein